MDDGSGKKRLSVYCAPIAKLIPPSPWSGVLTDHHHTKTVVCKDTNHGENTKIDEGVLSADSVDIEEELIVRDSTIVEIIGAHSSKIENLEDTDEVTLGGTPVPLPGSVQNSSGAEGGFLWNDIFLFASGGYGQIANYNANGFSIVNGGEGPFIIGSNGGDIHINSGQATNSKWPV